MNFLGNKCACQCNALSIKQFQTSDYNFEATTASAWVNKCQGCGSLFPELFPTPETIGAAYVQYYTKPKERIGLRQIIRRCIDLTRTDHLRRRAPIDATKIMDYGCGSGDYLRLLYKSGHGARLFGTDITRPQGFDGKVIEWISLEDCCEGDRNYNWITLSHVIEHLPEPLIVLSKLNRCCIKDGGLWISTPNADSLLIDIFRGYARDVDFPRHRQVFSRTGLAQMLEVSGFHVEYLPSPRVDTLMNFVSCCRNVLRDSSLSSFRKVLILIKGIGCLALHLLKPATLRAIDGPEIVVIARPFTD